MRCRIAGNPKSRLFVETLFGETLFGTTLFDGTRLPKLVRLRAVSLAGGRAYCASSGVAFFLLLCLPVLISATAQAQVAVSLGVQEIYDDNIFLEDNKSKPAPFVLDSALEQDFQDGTLSTLLPKQSNGKPDDDLITSVTLGLSSTFPWTEKYARSEAQVQAGLLFFADNPEEDRVTLDGVLDLEASDLWLPKPYFLSLRGDLQSQSNDVGVAQGTETKATETLTTTGSLGIRELEVLPRTFYDLYYTGSYHLSVGALRIQDSNNPTFEDRGADYQTHTGTTAVDYDLAAGWKVGLIGSVGVQLFTNLGNSNSDRLQDAGSQDRTIADGHAFSRYEVSDKLSLNTSAGLGYSKLHDQPAPREVSFIGSDGKAATILVQETGDQQALLFDVDARYTFTPGTLTNAGVQQSLATDVNGDRIITRSVFLNQLIAITDRISLTGAGTYIQFSGGDQLNNASNRYEASATVNYSLTQFTALSLGYNYINQAGKDSDLQDRIRLNSTDYEVNRVFLSLNTGIVGVPLY